MSGNPQPQQYFVLIAPAVAFLFVLSSRQARISTIARDNVKQILASEGNSLDWDRAANLNKQNVTLLFRYHLIQCALIVLCIGLLTLGLLTLNEYFRGQLELFWAGVIVMGVGTAVTLFEIITGADTLRLEVDFAEWYRLKDIESKRDVPKLRRFALFRPWKRSKTSL